MKPITDTFPLPPADAEKLVWLKDWLDLHFLEELSLAKISRLCLLNEFKLKKGFKACFSTTIKSYVTQLTMEHAKNLFKSKSSNVGEVAYKCGYKDVSHFSAAFKSFYGFTPISFRKINTYTKLHFLFFESIDFFPWVELLSL